MTAHAVTSEVGVCSLAMGYLKLAPLNSIDEPVSEQEIQCAEVFHQVRRRTLEMYPWNFAKKRAVLSASLDTPEFGFTRKYAFRNDHIRFLSRHHDDGTPMSITAEDYDIEDGFFLTNADADTTINIKYVSDHKQVGKWSPLFLSLLATEIAVDVGHRFVTGNNWLEQVRKERDRLRVVAGAIDGQQRPPRRVQRSKWIARRRQGTQVAGPNLYFRS